VIAEGVRVHKGAEVAGSIRLPGVEIGPGAHVRRAILDGNVRIGRNTQVGFGPRDDARFNRTENGIVVIPANSVVSPQSEEMFLPGTHMRQINTPP
jgi:glucose-1-phosphate adenylyltransferase